MDKLISILATFFFSWVFIFIVCITVWAINYEQYKPQCLEKGFPITEVTYKLEVYCISRDGTNVEKIKSSATMPVLRKDG